MNWALGILGLRSSAREPSDLSVAQVNKRQLGACLPKIKDWAKIVIAYEPVWAIGTGKVATPEQAEETQKAIRQYISQAVSPAVAEKVRIQYGGSVNPENCAHWSAEVHPTRAFHDVLWAFEGF